MTLTPPQAPQRPKSLSHHDDTRVDPFYWMRQRDQPELLAYLHAENRYTDSVMAPIQSEAEALYQEILGRIKETDMSAPYDLGAYRYYHRTEAGKNYPVYCRAPIDDPTREEILLDGNLRAKDHAYYNVGGMKISDHEQLLAFGEDINGDFFQTLRFKDLENDQMLADAIPDVAAFCWAADNQSVFYAQIDATKRPHRIYRHTIGTPPQEDVLVYEERDPGFRTYVFRSRSKAYLIIGSSSNISDEYHLIPAHRPSQKPELFERRKPHHEFEIDHGADGFYVLTNWEARNNRLMFCPDNQRGRNRWTELQGHQEDVLLEGMELFESFYALQERHQGLIRIQIQPSGAHDPAYIYFQEAVYTTGLAGNPEYRSTKLRYHYTSYTTPNCLYEYDTQSGQSTLLKQQEIPSGHDPSAYHSERIWVTSSDQTQVPISLVYKKALFQKDGNNPGLITGYGSYGISSDAYFSPVRLSLLDRGFVVATAHVRGGMDLGRRWYDAGKLLQKKNTFSDFIACSEALIDQGYTRADRLAAQGGSAGGMLMGVVANERPDLYHAIIMDVPFVDVLTTMLDPSIPLTTNEYDEWGNPQEPPYYEYIKSYSPYDNIQKQAYPHILVVTAYNDANVQFWEPTKWVAKLRAYKQDQNYLLYRIDMDSGHAGPSGRYAAIRERAFEYSFLTGLLGMGAEQAQD